MSTLDDYRKKVKIEHCQWDNASLPTAVQYYEHSSGYVVEGFIGKQWLYLTCPKCDYDWSLGKLGVERE